MEAAAAGAPFVPPCSSTRRSPPTFCAAIAVRAPPLMRFWKTRAADAKGSISSTGRVSTFLAQCRAARDASESGSSSTSPPLPAVEDLENLAPAGPSDAVTLPLPDLLAAGPPSEGLVLDLGPDGAWDGRGLGSPLVKRFLGDDKERWFMWYHGAGHGDAGTGDSIGLVVSANGVHWKRGAGLVEGVQGAGLVMRGCNDWWAFDTMSLRPGDVLIMSSAKVRTHGAVYWLYYTGSGPEKVGIETPAAAIDVPKSLLGLAISQDGRHWARIEGDHHSGALLDVGAPGEWDSLFIAAPAVIYHGRGDLRMYYHSFDPDGRRFVIGMARSKDGIRWIKLGKVLDAGPAGSFDGAGVLNAHVVRRSTKDGGYLMAYEGVSADGRSSIGLAESPDGLKDWRRCGAAAEAVFGASGEGGWDDGGVGSPCLVQMDGEEGWRLYYRGAAKSGRTGIGLALSVGREPAGGFRRWTGFCTLK